ncbi:collagen alpha-1(I) chain-like [Melozone crissalis]|uniref:collagen alpha-1(I) chain-like n=1 Tax=Melozone crissalis TaxID=40204 RepID=UPI0023DB2BC6|nr:collagen alpha-1(I) chain-like [Melozone crissalis]
MLQKSEAEYLASWKSESRQCPEEPQAPPSRSGHSELAACGTATAESSEQRRRPRQRLRHRQCSDPGTAGLPYQRPHLGQPRAGPPRQTAQSREHPPEAVREPRVPDCQGPQHSTAQWKIICRGPPAYVPIPGTQAGLFPRVGADASSRPAPAVTAERGDSLAAGAQPGPRGAFPPDPSPAKHRVLGRPGRRTQPGAALPAPHRGPARARCPRSQPRTGAARRPRTERRPRACTHGAAPAAELRTAAAGLGGGLAALRSPAAAAPAPAVPAAAPSAASRLPARARGPPGPHMPASSALSLGLPSGCGPTGRPGPSPSAARVPSGRAAPAVKPRPPAGRATPGRCRSHALTARPARSAPSRRQPGPSVGGAASRRGAPGAPAPEPGPAQAGAAGAAGGAACLRRAAVSAARPRPDGRATGPARLPRLGTARPGPAAALPGAAGCRHRRPPLRPVLHRRVRHGPPAVPPRRPPPSVGLSLPPGGNPMPAQAGNPDLRRESREPPPRARGSDRRCKGACSEEHAEDAQSPAWCSKCPAANCQALQSQDSSSHCTGERERGAKDLTTLYHTHARGTPGSCPSLAEQHGGAPAPPQPPGAGQAGRSGADGGAGALCPCWSRLAAGRAGTLPSRLSGARAAAAGRSCTAAAAAAATGPRSAPSGRAGSGHGAAPPAPLCAKASGGFLRLWRAVRHGNVPGNVPPVTELRVTLSARCSGSGRSSSSPARSAPCTEERPGLQSPGAVQTRPEAPGESPPGEQQSAIAALPGAPAGRWPLGRCLALTPLRG